MAGTPHNRLDSWKEVAEYLHRDISTVMRWASDRGLPVHRVPGGKRHAVFAYPEEIDAWMLSAGPRDWGLGTGAEERGARGSGLGIREADQGSRGSGLGAELQVSGAGEAGEGARGSGLGIGDAGTVGAGLVPAQAGQSRGLPLQVPQTKGTRLRYTTVLVGGAIVVILALAYTFTRPAPQPRILGYTQLTNDGRQKPGRCLFTDGARIYFVEDLSNGRAIVQVPVSGGDVTPMSTAFSNPELVDFNQAGSEFLVLEMAGPWIPAPLWALRGSGGLPRRVGNILATAAAWSPDGARLAYATLQDLYVGNHDGSQARKIWTLPGILNGLSWSPDSRLLYLDLLRAGREVGDIWQVQPDGSNPHAVLAEWHMWDSTSQGVWTPDQRYFLIAGVRNGSESLWALRERPWPLSELKRQPVELSLGPLRLGAFALSLDGRKVYFQGTSSHRELLRFDRTSGRLVSVFPGVSMDDADFSKDGQWVAYVSPDPSLWKRRADGSGSVQLSFPPQRIELPRWSPDGKWIAFMGRRDRSDTYQVYLMPAEGGEWTAAWPDQVPQGAPTWSPDGVRLAFGNLLPGDVPSSRLAIHLVDVKTHEATTVPGSTGLWTARWSHDGKHMAAITADSQTLMVFDFRSQRWEKVATAGSISDVNWSRKSECIYFEDYIPPDGPAIFRVRLRDSKVEKVTSLTGSTPINSPWLGLAPDDSPLVVRGVGVNEIYAFDWEAP